MAAPLIMRTPFQREPVSHAAVNPASPPTTLGEECNDGEQLSSALPGPSDGLSLTAKMDISTARPPPVRVAFFRAELAHVASVTRPGTDRRGGGSSWQDHGACLSAGHQITKAILGDSTLITTHRPLAIHLPHPRFSTDVEISSAPGETSPCLEIRRDKLNRRQRR